MVLLVASCAARPPSGRIVKADVLGVWSDETGTAVPDGTSGSRGWLMVTTERGPSHCALQRVYFLRLAWPPPGLVQFASDASPRVFARDPGHQLPAREVRGSFDAHAERPSDVRDTGFHRGYYRIYVAADGDAAYVGAGTRFERWPRVRPGFGCL
jgi:hypothetical protein